jgi:flagellar protein FliS
MFSTNTPKQYAAYATANHTVNKTRQIVMLYDGTVRFMTQAREAMERNDIQERYNTLEKASAVISALQSAIDFENGGEIAQLLDNYYYSIYMRMISLHRSNSIEVCDAIIRELKIMRDSWHEVDNGSSTPDMPEATMPPSLADDASGMQVSI